MYATPAEALIAAGLPNPGQNFNAQMAKVGSGLLSGAYSLPVPGAKEGDIDQVKGLKKPRVETNKQWKKERVKKEYVSEFTSSVVKLGLTPRQVGFAPRLFKRVVGQGHPEFSTNKQQVGSFIATGFNYVACQS